MTLPGMPRYRCESRIALAPHRQQVASPLVVFAVLLVKCSVEHKLAPCWCFASVHL